MVKTMAGFGTPQADIALVMDMAPQTLRKHFRQELKWGAIEADMQVKNAMFKMASSGKYPAASMFWLKTRCQWREQHNAAKPGTMLPPQFHIKIEGSES
jgi:hypothetical protein